jgi:hypothetical protein
MRNYFYCTLVGLYGIFFIAPQIIHAQSCPPFTHKTTITGVRDSLPDGWFVFGLSGQTGLNYCKTRSGTPTIINNTNTDSISDVDISDDGLWILYLNKQSTAYLIKPDGTGKTPLSLGSGIIYAQFHHHYSPAEIVYIGDQGRVYRVGYHFGVLGNAIFDSTKVIVDFRTDTTKASTDLSAVMVNYSQFSICKNEFVCTLEIPIPPDTMNPPLGNPPLGTDDRTSYVTIPNQGAGIARGKNIYKYLTTDSSAWYGCGITVSNDGARVLANSNAFGGTSGCVPNQLLNPPMDHKGFYITCFMYDTMPSVPRDSVVLSANYGISINWCPSQYRIGTYRQLGFSAWSFSNDNDWVVGEQEGTNTPLKGVWIVNIPTNTWTLAYTASSTVLAPAMFLPETTTSVEQGMRTSHVSDVPLRSNVIKVPGVSSRITLEPSVYRCDLYSLSGKHLWTYSRADASERSSVEIPRFLRTNNAVVVDYITKAR